MTKFWANGSLIHPYSEVDQRRNRMLEIKAKQAHSPHRRGGDVEKERMSLKEVHEKEREAIEEEEARRGKEESEVHDDGESNSHKWLHRKEARMRQAEALESIDDTNARSFPKPGRWGQVWLGPTKQWYKVWVPDCYGKRRKWICSPYYRISVP